MKATQRYQRRRAAKSGPGVSLFPFLAVLICTMGALVPLLLAISRTARLQAEATAAVEAVKLGDQVKTQLEDVRWRIEQLRQSRKQTEDQVADARLQLGHIEDHSRRLSADLDRYRTIMTDLDRSQGDGRQQEAKSRAELERIRGHIAAARQQLADTKQNAAGRNRPYAVVPYEGPNQTHRRPIYLECRADAVVLQPEGIELTVADFEGPLGPGNPLAAALRAAREHLLAQRAFDPQLGEPYPMLLVRPDGIGAYYAARAAMKSWGADFGYELVGEDWKLAYPPSDPQLATVVRQEIASARVSQDRLAAAAPRSYGTRPKVALRASNRGGFVPADEPADGQSGYRSARASGPIGRAADSGSGYGSGSGYSAGLPSSPGGGLGGGAGGGAVENNPYLAVADGATGTGEGPAMGGNGNPGPAGSSINPGIVGQSAGVGGMPSNGGTPSGIAAAPSGVGGIPSGVAAAPSDVTGAASGGVQSPGAQADRPEGYIAGQPPRERPAASASSDPTASSASLRGHILRPGEWEPTPEKVTPPPEDKSRDHAGKRPNRPIDKHGEDWGLRGVAQGRGSIGVTRPIRVECYGDRVVVLSERGSPGTTIVLGPQTRSAVDPLVTAIWEHMDTWGMAGRGMYWRPVLQFHVAPDGQQRFAELTQLLAGSGLTVERR